MVRNVAISVAAVCAVLPGVGWSVQWVGNTGLFERGNAYPRRGAFLDAGQSMTITTQTWPIAANQRVVAVVTTDRWQSSQEYVFTFDRNVGNNSQWYLVLPQFPKNTWVDFYIRGEQWQGPSAIDSNGGSNFGYLVRSSPNPDQSAILQWYETDYVTMTKRLPEVVAAGYGAIYIPPPSKGGGGGFSVGYNPFDLFDLGDRRQAGSMRTKYGSTQQLQEFMRVAKRMGLEVYCDLVLNHMDNRASSPINRYPGLIPEDFHIRSSADTQNNEVNFSVATDFSFDMWNYDLVGLTDFAHEDGNNTQSGAFNIPSYASWSGAGKPVFTRHQVPQYYPGTFTPVDEDVRQYLKRFSRWLVETIGFDGFRLDAVKHIPTPFLGYAPDQPTGGDSFSEGDLLNYLYAIKPDLTIFGENFTGDSYANREYAKTGMNLLDFPLFFKFNDIFNSQGFGDLGAALSNNYGTDSIGMPYQNGGLSPLVGVSFVQSHDSGPPQSNNLAHAFTLTRPGRTKVYYDGNNIQPNNWSNFPRPGRGDSLGNPNDVVPLLLDARRRFARGSLVNRLVSKNHYIYERQTAGSSLMLVALNSRGDFTSLTATVQTAFEPGTVLEDLTGQSPNVTVGNDRRVTITTPSNSQGQNSNNARGFNIYVPVTAKPVAGTPPVRLTEPGLTISRTGAEVITELPKQTYDLPKGTHGISKQYEAYTVTGDFMNVRVDTTSLGHSAIIRFNQGIALGSRQPLTNTGEGLADGFLPMTKRANGQFLLENVDLRGLEDGLHTAKVRVFNNTGSRPGLFSEFDIFFFVNRTYRGQPIEGLITGNLRATQQRTASSTFNRADLLYVSNDSEYVYLGVAGRVDPSESLMNGFMAFLDTDPGTSTGVTNFATLKDDSGPATRLLSNRRWTAPPGFGAEFGLSYLRNSQLNSAPESPLGGGLVRPFTVGAEAGAFRLQNPQWFTGIPALMGYTPRMNSGESPRGWETAIRLRDLYPNGVTGPAQLGVIVGLGTTGESGSTLLYTDPNFEAYGGRPLPNPWQSNQFLPAQSSVVGDPGTNSVNLNLAQIVTLSAASTVPAANYQISQVKGLSVEPVGRDEWSIMVEVKALANINGPIHLMVKPGNSATLVGGVTSLQDPTSQGIRIASSLAAGRSARVNLFFRGPRTGFAPIFSLKFGNGYL